MMVFQHRSFRKCRWDGSITVNTVLVMVIVIQLGILDHSVQLISLTICSIPDSNDCNEDAPQNTPQHLSVLRPHPQ